MTYNVVWQCFLFLQCFVLCTRASMIYHHYDSALGQVLGTCSLACPFSRLFFSLELHEIPSGHPWCLQAMIFSTSPPHRRGARDWGSSSPFEPYFPGVSFFLTWVSSSFLSWLLLSTFTICVDAVGQFSVLRFHRVNTVTSSYTDYTIVTVYYNYCTV